MPARGATEGQLGSGGFSDLSKQGALNCPHRRWDPEGFSCQRKGGREMGRDCSQGQLRSPCCGFAGGTPGGLWNPIIWGSTWHCGVALLPHLASLPRSVFRVINKAPQVLAGLLRLPVQGAGSEMAWKVTPNGASCPAGSSESRVGGVIPHTQAARLPWCPHPGHPRLGTGFSLLCSLLITSLYTQERWGAPASSQLGALASSSHLLFL